MSESWKRVEIFFFVIDADFDTRVDTHKKGGIPARLQILVKIKFDQKKKELENEITIAYCVLGEKN